MLLSSPQQGNSLFLSSESLFIESLRLPSMSSSMKRTDVSPAPSPHNEFPEAASPLNRTSTREKSARPALDHHLRVEPHIKSSGGITGLGLDQFSDNDRFAAVVKFLANPHVFQQVSEALDQWRLCCDDYFHRSLEDCWIAMNYDFSLIGDVTCSIFLYPS